MKTTNGLYDVTITIDDVPVTSSPLSTFLGCTIDENIKDIYSACKIVFLADNTFFSGLAIVDGASIKIFVASESLGFNFVYYYRVSQVNIIQRDDTTYKYEVTGYSDFYTLFESPNNLSIYGNSSDVFKNIATKYNLEYEIDSTNDKQLWTFSEQNIKEWLNFITSKAWIDETSGMFWCLDRHRCLLFKDINTIFNSNTKYTAIPSTQNMAVTTDTISYISIGITNTSGQENVQNNGYGGDDFYYDLFDYKLNSVSSKKVRAYSGIININKDLSHGLKESFYPLNTGNFHKNYYLAHDQNKRVLSTFSTYYMLACQTFQPCRLGQLVLLVNNNLSNKDTSKAMNQKAMIGMIRTSIVENGVSMNIGLCSQGFNGASTTTY